MAKIVIYEDMEVDLVSRYSHLTKDHEVHVRYAPLDIDLSRRHERFKRWGFNPDNFICWDESREETADVYFLDGLNGYCFELIKFLPYHRAFINSGSEPINEEAREKGLNIVGSRRVEDIIQKVLEENQ